MLGGSDLPGRTDIWMGIVGKRAVERDDAALGLADSSVTRRDFVGGALLGTGAALLGMVAPGLLRAAGPADRNPAYPHSMGILRTAVDIRT